MASQVQVKWGVEDFLTAVVDFPSVAAGDPCEVLLGVADRLCAELGCPEDGEEAPGAQSPFGGEREMAGVLGRQEDLLIAQVRRRLAQVAAALGAGPEPDSAVGAALDGSEMVMRGELTSGNRDRLPSLMPSFVLLVALPLVEQDQALALSRRASELVAAAAG